MSLRSTTFCAHVGQSIRKMMKNQIAIPQVYQYTYSLSDPRLHSVLHSLRSGKPHLQMAALPALAYIEY